MKYFYLISLCIYLSNCSGGLLSYQLDTLYAVTKETAILCVSVVLTNLQMTRLIKNARTKYSYLSSRSTLPFHFNVFLSRWMQMFCLSWQIVLLLVAGGRFFCTVRTTLQFSKGVELDSSQSAYLAGSEISHFVL